MNLKVTLSIFLSAFLALLFEPKAKGLEKQLDFKALKHYQITLESHLYGVYREDKTVMSFPGEAAFYLKSEYKPEAKEQDLGFGTLHNPYDGSERIAFEPKDKQRRVRSVLHSGSRWAFLDVMSQQLMVWDDLQKAWQMPGDIILDTPKPPRDARGEPTRAETASLRAQVTKSLAKEKGNADLLAGIADIPKSWKDSDGSQYVLWLRGGSHALMTLKCDQSSFRVCQVQRACALSGMSPGDAEAVTSITLDRKSQTLLLLLRDKKIIRRLSGSSCARLKAENDKGLPKELANAQGIFVDGENNFWLALRDAEGATSASLFTWDKGAW